MQLLVLIEEPDHVCYRYRIAAYSNVLATQGWSISAEPVENDLRPFLDQLRRIASADVVVLQRRLLGSWKLRLLRKAAQVLIFDVDDAIFYRDSNSKRHFRSARREHRFRAAARSVDALTCGNLFLCQQAVTLADPSRVHHFPTTVDVERYSIARHDRSGADTRLGWIGSRSTLPSLQLVEDGLRAASRQCRGLRLKVICNEFPIIPGVDVEPTPWSSSTEASELASTDIGISWLPKHPWSLGKCGLKVLQYMAAGLPVVANPVGIHRQLVAHGETGMLATTPQQFAHAIQRLSDSPDLRRQMGRAAREFVIEQFYCPSWAKRFGELCGSFTGGRQRRRTA